MVTLLPYIYPFIYILFYTYILFFSNLVTIVVKNPVFIRV
nr:MAG TPA: hypothetical protein [Caudoviricetes sp.]